MTCDVNRRAATSWWSLRAGDGVLGRPMAPKWVREHTPGVAADLSHLDVGAAANTETVAQLIAHLENQGIEVRSHGRGGPRFVAGWIRGGVTHIAEVEQLTTGSEEGQIRLGLGQLLDYVHQLESQSTCGALRPVLVLEKEPRHVRWESLFQSRDVLLTWAPGFPGC